jgi:hypothetical protein
MPLQQPLRVFLCHSSGDKPIVRELYQKLSTEGWIDAWLDEEKLLPGQDWDYEIAEALDNSDAVIVFLSTASVSKEGYVQKEMRAVLDLALEKPEGMIFILPVRLDDCKLPRGLRQIQAVNYFPPTHRESAYTKLLFSLEACAQSLNIPKIVETKSVSPKPVRKKHKKQPFAPIREAGLAPHRQIKIDFELPFDSEEDQPTQAVAFNKLLVSNQSINNLQRERGCLIDVRNGNVLDLLNGPFDKSARTVDIRRVNSALTRGRYSIQGVGLFVPRIKTNSVTYTQAYCLEERGQHCFMFNALGIDTPLYIKTGPEENSSYIDEELKLPIPMRRRALNKDLIRAREDPNYISRYYGKDKSFAIWARGWPSDTEPQPIPPKAIVVADLTDWQYTPPLNHIAVDPVLGRIAFPPHQLPRRLLSGLRGVWVSYHYGSCADIGGGEYARALEQPARAQVVKVENVTQLQEAMVPWRSDWVEFEQQPHDGVIEIAKSGVYVVPFDLTIKPGHSLQLRAANRVRPIIRLLAVAANFPDTMYVTIGTGSRFILDGLLISGRPVHIRSGWDMEAQNFKEEVGPDEHDSLTSEENSSSNHEAISQDQNELAEIIIRHCTLVPGWELFHDGKPQHPAEPSLELYNTVARVNIDHSVMGAIQINTYLETPDPVPIQIMDSILDATSSELKAVVASYGSIAPCILTIRRCSVFGVLEVQAVELAENSIFAGQLSVEQQKVGGLQYCYIPRGSRTPPRLNCQPELAEKMAEAEVRKLHRHAPHVQIETARKQAQDRVRPQFTERLYGGPGYAQLARSCADEIKYGATDGSEMGVFHGSNQKDRVATLQKLLDEYAKSDLDAGIIYVS